MASMDEDHKEIYAGEISQRYLDYDDEETEEEQAAISSNILSTIIENQIEFVDPTTTIEHIKKKHRKTKNKIKLFEDWDEVVDIDKKFISKPQIRPKIIRRLVEPDEMSESDKIKSVAIDSSFILNQMDTKYWTDRKKSKISKYKSKTGNPYQFIEPENEFSKIRKKNCWSEKRISRTINKNT